jgi:hypothetical protein
MWRTLLAGIHPHLFIGTPRLTTFHSYCIWQQCPHATTPGGVIEAGTGMAVAPDTTVSATAVEAEVTTGTEPVAAATGEVARAVLEGTTVVGDEVRVLIPELWT